MDFDGWSKSDFKHDFVELMTSFSNQYQTASGRIRSMGPQVGKLRPEDKDFMLKFLQLKYSILYLQQKKVFGKYCFYGCWCLPRGAAQIGIGHGAPVDNIDQSCKEFSTCHSCLYNTQYGKGCNESSEVKYKVSGRVEVATGKKYLMCMDPPNTCNRMRCECDKALAEKLQIHENEWNIDHHRRWGGNPFDSDQRCLSNPEMLTQEMESPEQIAARQDEKLNGVFSSRIPQTSELDLTQRNSFRQSQKFAKQSATIYGPIIGCCGNAPTFRVFREGQRCCLDGEIVDEKAPCSLDFY